MDKDEKIQDVAVGSMLMNVLIVLVVLIIITTIFAIFDNQIATDVLDLLLFIIFLAMIFGVISAFEMEKYYDGRAPIKCIKLYYYFYCLVGDKKRARWILENKYNLPNTPA